LMRAGAGSFLILPLLILRPAYGPQPAPRIIVFQRFE